MSPNETYYGYEKIFTKEEAIECIKAKYKLLCELKEMILERIYLDINDNPNELRKLIKDLGDVNIIKYKLTYDMLKLSDKE